MIKQASDEASSNGEHIVLSGSMRITRQVPCNSHGPTEHNMFTITGRSDFMIAFFFFNGNTNMYLWLPMPVLAV